MERNFKRISKSLKLPRESRERIRSQLASHQAEQEVVPMKKENFKGRVPLLIAAVVMAAALTLTAGAVTAARFFRNDIILSSKEEIFTHVNEGEDDAPAAAGIMGPRGNPPSTLEKVTQSDRFISDDWTTGDVIDTWIVYEYRQWDSVEVLSNDPVLRSRRIGREDGAEKMEYTAENPINLLDTLTGRATFDLTWVDEHYNYVPDANYSFVVTDEKGNYVGEVFNALYAKPDESGYVRVEFRNIAEADYYARSYIIDSSFETAYYYTTPDGYEFLITMNTGNVWVSYETGHTSFRLYGAYLTSDEVEDILDNLSLSVAGQP